MPNTVVPWECTWYLIILLSSFCSMEVGPDELVTSMEEALSTSVIWSDEKWLGTVIQNPKFHFEIQLFQNIFKDNSFNQKKLAIYLVTSNLKKKIQKLIVHIADTYRPHRLQKISGVSLTISEWNY